VACGLLSLGLFDIVRVGFFEGLLINVGLNSSRDPRGFLDFHVEDALVRGKDKRRRTRKWCDFEPSRGLLIRKSSGRSSGRPESYFL